MAGGADAVVPLAVPQMETEPDAVPREKSIADSLEVCLATLCLAGRLPLAALMCAWGVARAWREAVARALLHLKCIDFPSNVKGADALTMLERVAGKTLKTVCLEGCRKLTGDDAARILVRVAEGCPAVFEVKLAGCRKEAILHALAAAAEMQLGAGSPADLRAMLLALAADSRCPLALLLGQMAKPALRVSVEGEHFAPGRGAFREAVEWAIKDEEAVWVVALLMACAFNTGGAGEDMETITFDCNADLSRGKRALHLVAAGGGPLALLHLLLVAGALVDAKDGGQNTPLHLAAEKGLEGVCAELLRYKADANAKNLDGETPLHRAAGRGDAAVVAALLGAGAAVGAKNMYGETPLHRAANRGDAAVVAALLGAGAPAGARNNLGFTPLHGAAIRGHAAVVAALLGAGAATGAKSKNGFTPLHMAAQEGDAAVVAALLGAGAAAGASNNIGETPLHLAAVKGHAAVVAALLGAGAAVGAKNNNGDTPLKLAERYRRTAVAELLRQQGARG